MSSSIFRLLQLSFQFRFVFATGRKLVSQRRVLLLPKRLNFPEREKNSNVNAQRTPRSRSHDHLRVLSLLRSTFKMVTVSRKVARVVKKKNTQTHKENIHERARTSTSHGYTSPNSGKKTTTSEKTTKKKKSTTTSASSSLCSRHQQRSREMLFSVSWSSRKTCVFFSSFLAFFYAGFDEIFWYIFFFGRERK